MTQQHENFFTTAINEAVDMMIEVLGEYFRDDLVTGFLEEEVPQDQLRSEFEAIANQTDLTQFEQSYQDFVQQYGEDAWNRQQSLALQRNQRPSAQG